MKLLNYTSARHLLFAALLLLISIPVLYIVLNKVFINAVDKDLYQQSNEIPAYVGVIRSERDLALWMSLDNDLDIVNAADITYHHEPFTEKKRNRSNGKEENFRILQKRTNILGKEYVVGIESSMIEKEDLIKTILWIQLSLLCLLLVGWAFINYYTNKKIWSPFYKIVDALKDFDIDQKVSWPLLKERIIEFNQLNASVRQLFERVRRSYALQKEFTENASHELQTPLASLKFKLELLLQEAALSQNQSALISDMYRIIEQLDELNKNLLLLSKIENGQFAVTRPTSVPRVIEAVKNELAFVADSRQQQILVRNAGEDIVVSANGVLLKILVKNLLLNALQYSPQGSQVIVNARYEQLVISNPGPVIDIPEDQLFSRFSRSASQNKGNGLGLAIVKAIADTCGMKVCYTYCDGHNLFQVQW